MATTGVDAISVAGRFGLCAEVLVAYLLTRRSLRTGAPLGRDGLEPVVQPWDVRPPLTVQEAARLAGRARRVLRATLRRDPSCLALSMVVARLLRRRGTAARLVIGVTGARDFSAHAWVEVGDRPILPGGEGFHRLLDVGAR